MTTPNNTQYKEQREQDMPNGSNTDAPKVKSYFRDRQTTIREHKTL